MPYPNEHAVRVIEPEKFQKGTFRRKNIADGIDVILGKLEGENKMSIQAYRFDKEKFTFDQVKEWIKEHNIKFIKMEKAIENRVTRNNSHSIVTNMSELIRVQKFEDKEFLVCPAVLITEGVHNGLYYSAEELSKFPEAWNGRPVCVYHPTMKGKPITANSPEVIEKQVIGQLFNTKFEDGRLKSEVWIDRVKMEKNFPEIYSMLKQNKVFEVSTGLFTEDEVLSEEKEWNGEKYKIIAKNYRPDHLALLPNGIGSCSWKDGAGMPRINEDLSKTLSAQRLEEDKISEQKQNAEVDVERKEIIEKLFAGKLIEEVDKELLLKVSDLLFEKLAGLISSLEENSTVNNEEKKDEEKKDEEKKDEEKKDEEKIITNEVGTIEEFVEKAPDRFRTELLQGLKLHQEKKQSLIQSIKANKANKFTDDELSSKTFEELEKLSEIAKVSLGSDFSVSNSVPKTNTEENLVPEMPKIEFKNNK